MKKMTSKKQLILYGCSGIGVNMLNIIVGTYLCSALLVGGFEKNIENWTYLNKDLVVAGIWGTLILVAKIIDGIIDVPFSAFIDNIRTKFGRRKTGILIGYLPMLVAYLLFLVPINSEATILNTLWFAFVLFVFYGAYTITMLTYYATFSEIVDKKEDLMILSNTKSICDVVYFSLSFALVPAFVSMGMNIRIVALIFMPLALTMLIPMFLLKENDGDEAVLTEKVKPISLKNAILGAVKCKEFMLWLGVLAIMNFGLQLFLSGINEFFSTAGLDMTFIMATCFAPVPATIFIYNFFVKKFGLGFGYRYVLGIFSLGMALMALCNILPSYVLFPMALFCSFLVSFAIGAFFSVTYTVPSHIAAKRREELGNEMTSTMFFAVQGLAEGISAGLASGVMLVFLKQNGLIPYMTLIVAASCMVACALSFFLPKTIQNIGKMVKKDDSQVK